MNKKQNRGITLVALVITIIVLIILAGVSINAVVNGGLITNAKDAKNKYDVAKQEESTELIDLEVTTDFASKVTQGYGNEGVPKYTPYLIKYQYITGVTVGDKVSEFEQKLPQGYEVYISETEPANDALEITTGMILKKEDNEVGRIVIYGDIDCNGVIDMSDQAQVNNMITDDFVGETYQEIAADVNYDGYINSEDLDIIKKWFDDKTSEQNVEVQNKDLIIISENYCKEKYIKNLPIEFTSAYKVYYSDQYNRYQIDVNKNEVTAEQFLSKLQDENAKLLVYVEQESAWVEKNDSTPITKAARLFTTYPEFDGKREVLMIMVQ